MISRRLALIAAAALMTSGSAVAADLNQQFEDAFAPGDASGSSTIASLWLGGVILKTTDGDFDEEAIFGGGGDLRHHFGIASGWDLQLELAAVGESNADADNDDESSYHVIGGVHVINRTDSGAWGLFGAATHTMANDTGDEIQHILGGFEVARFSDMNQYNFQIGGHTTIGGDPDDTWDQGIFGTASLRHFYSETSAVRAAGGIGGDGTFDGDEDAIWGQWIIDYERQLDGSAYSFFAAYQGDMLHEIGDWDWDDNMINHALKIGLRGTFGGGGTIYSVAHNGAGTFALPDLHMPLSFTDDLW
jgi:hypothetical protein